MLEQNVSKPERHRTNSDLWYLRSKGAFIPFKKHLDILLHLRSITEQVREGEKNSFHASKTVALI